MALRKIKRRKVVASIVVTPLVDVVLVLLVLFLVLTPLLARSLDVRQPHATVPLADDGVVPSTQLVVQAHPKGLWINGVSVDPADLVIQLSDRLRQGGSQVVFFQGHKDLRYGDVIHYLDLIRASGAEILGMAPELELAPDASTPE